jgi:hypothetical protein
MRRKLTKVAISCAGEIRAEDRHLAGRALGLLQEPVVVLDRRRAVSAREPAVIGTTDRARRAPSRDREGR